MPSTPDEHAADLVQLISRRRMVRSFARTPVDPALVRSIVRAGQSAPSAGNTRSLEVLVLADDTAGNYWDTTLPAQNRPSFPWPKLLDAPVLIIPYVDPTAYVSRYGETDKAHTGLGDGVDAWPVPYWWVDGGAAAENMLLAAEAYGLGACLFGQFEHEPAVRERFGVPDHLRAVGTIATGHIDPSGDRPSKSASRPRRKSEETVHFGRWNEAVSQ